MPRLLIEGADAAEMRLSGEQNNGLIFFSSRLAEERIQQINQQVEKVSATKQHKPADARR
jgi:hypothetical protein